MSSDAVRAAGYSQLVSNMALRFCRTGMSRISVPLPLTALSAPTTPSEKRIPRDTGPARP